MSDSLLTGVTGLQANQMMLDVVGNNLANSNTVGFKAQRITFQDLVYQTLSPATSSSQNLGGTNPAQVGLGVRTGSIDTLDTQGGIQSTGRELDVALQGQGYFVLRGTTGDVYTRDGAFGVDADNFLVDPATGNRVQRFGSVGESSAAGPAFQTAGNNDIKIPLGTSIPGHATGTINLQGNLSAAAAGPAAQVLTSAQPFTTTGGPASATTALNSLSDNQTPYVGTDKLLLQGTTTSGTAVSATLNLTPTSTLGDLVNAIDANFAGATASIDSAGNLVVTSSTTGPSSLSVTISDAAGNTGKTNWANHSLGVSTTGSAGASVQSAIQVYDTQGNAHNINLTFQKQTNGTWNLTAQMNPSDGTLTNNTITGITFNADGSFRQAGGSSITAQFAGLTAPQTIAFNFGTAGGFDGLTQMGGASGAAAVGQDGFAPGALNSLTINQDGTINGNFSNGRSIPIAQLAVATFANAEALDRIGNNDFASNPQSGDPQLGAARSGGRGEVIQQALESSNVDISLEFTQLIIAQRGYEVNSRTISVSSQIIQDLVNIIH